VKNLESVQDLFGRTIGELTNGAWPAFLKTAAWTFKYSFPDQLLIYAQRPDARACASIDVWNKRLNRTVNPNAAHIALIDDRGDDIRLRYVVDVADTAGPGKVPLWRLTEKNADFVYTSLAAGFDVPLRSEEDKTQFFVGLAEKLVNQAMTQASFSLQRVQAGCEGLKDLTAAEAEASLRELLTASVAATMMYRCDLVPNFPEGQLSPFRNIHLFRDPRALSVLGQTAQAASRDALMVAAKAAQDWAKTHKEEIEYANTVPESRGVSDPRADHGADRAAEPVRQAAEELSADAAPQRVHGDDADRPAAAALEGNRPGRADDVRAGDGSPDEGVSGAQQGAELQSLDSAHDEAADAGRADGSDEPGVRLTEENLPAAAEYGINVSFPTTAQQAAVVASVNGLLQIPQEEIDLVLTSDFSGKLDTSAIHAFYTTAPGTEEAVTFLRQQYGHLDDAAILPDGRYVAVQALESGLHLTSDDARGIIPWDTAASRIRQLHADRRYPAPVAEAAPRITSSRELSQGQTFTLAGVEYLVTGMTQDTVTVQDVAHPIFSTPMERSVLDLLLKNEARNEVRNEERKAPSEERPELAPEVSNEASAQEETDEPEVSEPEIPQPRQREPFQERSEALAKRNYRFLEYYAPEIMNGSLDYMRFESDTYEPLYIERIGKDRIAIAHTFTQMGDLMYDPEMTFAVREDSKELLPLSFEQSDMQVYQRVYESEADLSGKNASLERDLNSFFRTWSQNLLWQEHTPVRGTKFRSAGDLEYTFDENRQMLLDQEEQRPEPQNQPPQPLKDKGTQSALSAGDVFTIEGTQWQVYEVIDDRAVLTSLETGEAVNFSVEVLLNTVKTEPENLAQQSLEPDAENPVPTTIQLGDFYEDAYGKGIVTNVLPEEYNGKIAAMFTFVDPDAEPGSRAAEGYGMRLDLAIERIRNGEATLIPASEHDKKLPHEREQELTLFDFETEPEAKDEKAPVAVAVNAVPDADGRINYRIPSEAENLGGPKARYQSNVAAIRLLKQLEEEDRLATAEEQKILAKYVGWGGIPQAFDSRVPQWENEYKELKELLTEEEYASALESTMTAFYTPPEVTEAIYAALDKFGFRRGNILDPCCGTGNFFGMLPEHMADSKLYGVELDSISGRISRQLYQNANILIEGYEKSKLPDSFYDVAIGNVPFGDFKLNDRRYDKENFLIHDYFFAKTLDKVRPGGIIAFVTSTGTMDKANDAVRRYIAQRADLLGAIRLPNNTFKENAGTDVASDILFLKKWSRPMVQEPDWLGRSYTWNDEKGTWGPIANNYFAENPDMVLGTIEEVSGPHGPKVTCLPREGEVLRTALAEAVSNLTGYIDLSMDELEEEETQFSIPADPNVRNFSYTLVDGNIYFREDSRMYPVEINKTAEQRIKGLISLRDLTHELIDAQLQDEPDSKIFLLQQELSDAYDAFTKKYGIINSRANSTAFSDDSAYFLLCSLEHVDDEGNFLGKADMFYKRTIGKHTTISHTDTAQEALAVCMGEKGKVDLSFISDLCGLTTDEVLQELKGLVFPVPGREGAYEISSIYLSGNVRQKLLEAQEAAKKDPRYALNAEYLESVIPTPLPPEDIAVRLGATWLPQEDISDFIHEVMEFDGYRAYLSKHVNAVYEPILDTWNITNKHWDSGTQAYSTYGTEKASAYRLLEDALNQKNTQLFDVVTGDDGKERRVLNAEATMAARDKQELLKEKFKEWIWSDPERTERLAKLYNEKFNSMVPPSYDANMVVFHGMNPHIQLEQHQKESIARILYGGNTQLAHNVGAGKTWTMVAAAMEGKHLGLCNKSLIVVPNHLVGQWAAAIYDLYPAANVLASTKKDFETKNRKKFCSRIATGDYDIVVIGHSQFERIPLSTERQEATLRQQIQDITNSISELKDKRAESFSIKQMERMKKQLTGKLEKLQDGKKRDDVVTFEELGVDRLFVDESHEYKNLFLYTKMHNVAGISQTDSQKASDLFMKCRYMDELTGNKGNIHATGTPLSNTMAELYTTQRYLQYDLLQQMGLGSFDAWASTFGETVQSIELAPEGQGYRERTRFANFFNLPELIAIYKQTADVRPADVLNLPVPDVEYHTDVVAASEEQKAEVEKLSERADAIRQRKVNNKEDNMLCITNDGRKLALDQRLINPELPDNPNSKVNACVKNILKYYRAGEDEKLTQLVFCDLSTPTGNGFNVYQDLKDKLVAKGIPADEIRFIHEANSDAQKEALFAKVRSGAVRVLMGSTSKMGTGTNVQDRLIAGHDLDCPWRPSDLEQRAGRVIRRGNQNKKVHIHRYVTENTFDAYLYQLIESKQRFASQIFTSKSPVRAAADVDESVLNYSQIKALASGNPRVREKIELEIEVARLKAVENNYKRDQRYLAFRLKSLPQNISETKERLQGLEEDQAQVIAVPSRTEKGELLPAEVQGITYENQTEAGKAIFNAMNHLPEKEKWFCIGHLRGFRILAKSYDKEKPTELMLSGKRSYSIPYSDDAVGLMVRLNNVLDYSIPKSIRNCKNELIELAQELQSTNDAYGKPFHGAQVLKAKQERLRQLEAELSLDTAKEAQATAEKDIPTPAADKVTSLADRISNAQQRQAQQITAAHSAPTKELQYH